VTVDPAVAALILLCTAGLFGSAALHKFRALHQFDAVFEAYGIVPRALRRPLSRSVPVIEALLAVGLLLDVARRPAAGVGIALLLAYAAAIGVNLSRGRRDLACGCGGPDERRPIAGWMVWRNILLAGLLAATLLPWAGRPWALTDLATVGCGSMAASLIYLILDRLLDPRSRLAAEPGISS